MLLNPSEILIQKNDIVEVEELALQNAVYTNCCKLSLD